MMGFLNIQLLNLGILRYTIWLWKSKIFITENICEQLAINKKDKVLCNIHDLATMKLMADTSLKLLQENIDIVL